MYASSARTNDRYTLSWLVSHVRKLLVASQSWFVVTIVGEPILLAFVPHTRLTTTTIVSISCNQISTLRAQVRASESTPRSSPSSRSGSRTSRWDTARMAGGSISSSAVGNWTATRTADAIPGTCGARCRLRAGSYTCYSRCGLSFFFSFRSVSFRNRAADVYVNSKRQKKTDHVFLRRRSSRPIFGQVRGRLWDCRDQVHHIGFRHAGIPRLLDVLHQEFDIGDHP